MPVETLTYGALAERLGISPRAAQSFARRLRLPRALASDGRARVTVDLGEITHRPRPAREPASPEQRIASLRAQIAQLEATAATYRADFERERDRADSLMTELLKATGETTAARAAAARLEGEVAALRIGAQWAAQRGPPDRLRQLAASVVEADRRTRG